MKVLFILLALVSCSKDPVAVSSTNNSEINVGLLFEHDGCKVYRFSDGGNYKYYTNCGQTMWTESYQCGKSRCRREHSI